jgi:hypothetical protein
MYAKEDLMQRMEDESLRNKELQREIADMKLLLHRSQSGIFIKYQVSMLINL